LLTKPGLADVFSAAVCGESLSLWSSAPEATFRDVRPGMLGRERREYLVYGPDSRRRMDRDGESESRDATMFPAVPPPTTI
jgi:hypothetical protein